MTRKTLRIFVVLALLSVLGIVVTEVYWFKKAYDNDAQEFDKNIDMALRNVAKGILTYNNRGTLGTDPVKKLEHNYYAVMVNDRIDANVLEHYLVTEFKKMHIRQSFAYSIYDCENRRMVYGGYVSDEDKMARDQEPLPKQVSDNYYFTVYFPHKTASIIGQMGLWLYSSAVLLIVIIFFSYSLFVIFRQKRLWEVQRDFINNMTHEFKTPLSTISISAATLRDPAIAQAPQRLLTYATIILDEATKLKDQVERVLSIAGTETQMKLQPEVTDLHALIKESGEACMGAAGKKTGIDLHLDATQHTVLADPLHISNVLSNLLDNSIKYSGEQVHIDITTRNVNRMIEVRITDQGIGIAKEHLAKIFDRFYRVPTGNVHNVKGFGIGLYYVRLVTRAHRGTISVTSSPGHGTTFKLALPLHEQHNG